jgi:hypothetical protein
MDAPPEDVYAPMLRQSVREELDYLAYRNALATLLAIVVAA